MTKFPAHIAIFACVSLVLLSTPVTFAAGREPGHLDTGRAATGSQQAQRLVRMAAEVSQREPKRAIEYAERALAAVGDHDDSALYVAALTELAAACLADNQPQRARQATERALTLTPAAAAPARLSSLHGRTLARLGENAAAEPWLRRAIEQWAAGGRLDAEASAWEELSQVQRHFGRFDDARASLNEALRRWQGLGRPGDQGRVVHALGGMDLLEADYEGALDEMLRALVLLEQHGSAEDLAGALADIGLVYSKTGDLNKGVENKLRALELLKDAGDDLAVHRILNNIGVDYYDHERYDESIDYYRQALALSEAIGHPARIGMSHVNLGGALIKAGQPETAEQHLRRALKVAGEVDWDRLQVYAHRFMAESQLALGAPEVALDHARSSLEYAEQLDIKAEIRDVQELLASIHESRGDYRQALAAHRTFKRVNDEIFDKEKSDKVARLREQFEAEKREGEIALLRQEKELQAAELRQQRTLRNVGIGAVAGSSLLMVLLYVPYVQRRTNRKLAQRVSERTEQLEQKNHDLSRLNNQLDRLSNTDMLTGLLNRRSATSRLQRLLERRDQGGGTPAIMLFDLDWFKSINDRFGHEAGDEVLIAVARCVQRVVRPCDLVCRWGGEEFMTILPDSVMTDAVNAAWRVQQAIAALRFGFPGSVTASVGVASASQLTTSTVAELVKLADEALYRAKASGRNRVEHTAEPSFPQNHPDASTDQPLRYR